MNISIPQLIGVFWIVLAVMILTAAILFTLGSILWVGWITVRIRYKRGYELERRENEMLQRMINGE